MRSSLLLCVLLVLPGAAALDPAQGATQAACDLHACLPVPPDCIPTTPGCIGSWRAYADALLEGPDGASSRTGPVGSVQCGLSACDPPSPPTCMVFYVEVAFDPPGATPTILPGCIDEWVFYIGTLVQP